MQRGAGGGDAGGGCLLQACSQQSAPADLPKTESRAAGREEASSAGAVPEKGEPEEPALKGINDLTGMPMDEAKENNRPLAVMINNIDIAQPLMGVSQSDVMYECLAEGGITRIMACFKDPRGLRNRQRPQRQALLYSDRPGHGCGLYAFRRQ